ncbi:MAG: YceI family protein [Balneola sp.]
MNESKLSILGTSNVTDFECLYDNDFRIDTLSHYLTFDQGIIKVSGDTLKLKIENFDCGKRGINKDFRSSLKSNEYPSIDISLISFKQSDTLLKAVNVIISLAGSEKQFELEFKSSYLENGLIKIEGEQKLTMSDFNITPPRALLGLIKVRDELTIKFELLLKTI